MIVLDDDDDDDDDGDGDGDDNDDDDDHDHDSGFTSHSLLFRCLMFRKDPCRILSSSSHFNIFLDTAESISSAQR